MKRITFTVSEEMHKALKMQAARKNTTIKNLFWEAMVDMDLAELESLSKKAVKLIKRKKVFEKQK